MKQTRSIMSIAMATIVLVSLCAVCASTSVSAAQSSSRPSVQATPSLVGSPIAAGTSPAACGLNGTTSMYVFVKGNDSALWYRIWNIGTEAWTGNWIPLGGQLTSSPTATSQHTGRMDVFVRGTNGAIYEKSYSSGAWGGWYSLGGQVASGTGPAACSYPSNGVLLPRESVFVEGTNGALYLKEDTGAGWSGWVNLGGQLTSSPTATVQDIGQINVFVRGTNGSVYGKVFIDWSGGWRGWYSLGGQVASGTGPTACSCILGYNTPIGYRLDVFVEGTNGALYQKTYQQGHGWTSWATLGGQLSSSPTAATPFTNNGGAGFNMLVLVRGAGSGLLYYKIGYCDVYARAGTTTWTGWYGPYQGPP